MSMRRSSPDRAVENKGVVGPGAFPLHQLGLGDGGPEIDVPQRRRFGRIGLAPTQEAQEGLLGGAAGLFSDRRVERAPIDREPEVPEHLLEGPLVLGCEPFAQLDEIGPANSDGLLSLCQASLRRAARSRAS